MSDLSRRIANLSPEKRALFASRHKEGQEGYHSSAIPTRQPAERYPLSFAQQRLWFVDLFLPDSALYNNLGVALRFTGELDVAALERSLNEIVRRHEILRTTFIAIEGEPFQVIAESGSIPLSLLNLETLPAAERETEALRRAALASHEPFDLSRGPLLRASVIRLNPQEHLLFLLLHHIITDHESNAVLMREISALYSAFVADKPSPLPELPIQFADFAVWERERLCGENLERLLAYWTTQLSGTLPTLALPRSHASQNPSRFQAMTYTFTVAPDLLAGLKELSRKTGTTLYMQLLAAFKIVLYGYTRQNDIIVGTPVSNRNRLELENLLGMFVNNLVLRTDLSGNPAFLDLLQRVREVTLSAYDHQDMPFEKLVEVLRPERVSDQTPIIQVAFSYIAHTSLPDTVELPGLRLEPLSLPDDMVDLEMLLSVGEEADGLHMALQYRSDLFDLHVVERFAYHYITVLEAILADPAQRLDALTQAIALDRTHLRPAEGAAGSAPASIEEPLTSSNLTRSQLLFWMGQKLQPEVPLYNSICTFALPRSIEPEHFINTFHVFARNTDILRTIIEERDGIPYQRVLRSIPCQMAWLDLSQFPDPRAAFTTWMRNRNSQRFVLEKKLVDTVLVKLNTAEFVWYLASHHTILDKQSVSILCRRLLALYELSINGSLPNTIAYPQFAEYVTYEHIHRNSPTGAKAERYWQQKIAQELEPLQFYGRPAVKQTTLIDRVPWSLGVERSQQLKALITRSDYSLVTSDLSQFAVFATVLFAYLYRVSGNSYLSIGTPFQTRQEAFKETIGLFMEACPLRVTIAQGETFHSLFQKVRCELLEALQHWPYATPNFHNTVYDVLLNYHPHVTFPDQVRYTWHHSGHGNDSLNMQIDGVDQAGDFRLLFDFHRDVFPQEQYHTVIQHMLGIFDSLFTNDRQPLAEIDFLSPEEKQWQLTKLSRGKTTQVENTPIHCQFERQVALAPEAIAVVCGDSSLTYGCLNARANQLAHYLRTLGVGPETRVGVCLERSPEMIVSILGILKAGGVYVPLDPTHPMERLSYMMEAASVAILITGQAAISDSLKDKLRHVICLDTLESLLRAHSASNPAPTATGDYLFYIIYTSGSTGWPKGAGVYQRGFANLLSWFISEFAIAPSDRVLLVTSLSFDLTQKNIFAPLLVGAELHLLNAVAHDTPVLLQTIQRFHITLLNCTPSTFYPVVDSSDHFPLLRPESLRLVFLGGEAIARQKVERWLEASGVSLEVVNTYGPTECTDICAFHRLHNDGYSRTQNVPIGKPVSNTQLYILSDTLQLVPVGTIGELYIAGAGVGAGYINDASLTSARFLPYPFSERPGARLYKSGDLARYLPGGEIEFLGRRDEQVKLRGFRIEPEEIQVALEQHPALDTSVVMLKEDERGDQRLVAYIVASLDDALVEQELHNSLKRRLPEYMIPSVFVKLPALPLTSNGKVDRQALLAMSLAFPTREETHVAPRSEAEATVARIWSELLGKDVQEIGVYDNFFSLGGHSLLATQLLFRIHTIFGVDLPLLVLFQVPTIADLTIAILQAQLAQEDSDTIAQLLSEMEQLPEDDE